MKRKVELSRKKKINISGDKLKEYKDVFNLLDKNKKGMIFTSDIIKIKSIFSFPIGKEEVQEMINEIDQNRKGKIDFKKFIDFMKMQIQFMNENDEDSVFSSFKEQFKNEFLGNKRKREIISSNNVSRYEDESDLSLPDSTFRSEDAKDNIIIELEESLENKKNKKVKSRKFGNEDNISHNSNNSNYKNKNNKIDSYKDDEDNKSEYFYYKKSRNNYILNNKKNVKENRKRGRPKLNKEIFEESYTIQIYKHNLPKELITQIESKNKNNFLENKKKNEKENNDSFCMKTKLKESPVFNSKKNLERDNNQKSPISNKLDFNCQNETITSYNFNGISNKSPKFLAQREDNTNKNSPNKYTEGMKEKSIKKKTNNSNNEENKKKNIKPGQLKKCMNEKICEANNCNKDNNINKYNNNYKITDGNNINDSISKENKMKENKINSNIKRYDKNQKTPHKNLKNVYILNNFEFEYRKNKKNEKLVKDALEPPYSIIIEKSALNMDEIKNFFKTKKKNHLSKSATIKSENKKKNLDNSFDIIIYNNDDSEDNLNRKYKIKKNYNKTYEKERKAKIRNNTRNIKNTEYEYYKNKWKKKLKNGKSEDFELSNIRGINSNCSFENLSHSNTSLIKNTTVNGNNFTSTENNNYSSDRNYSNINSNDEDLDLSINWI